MNVSLRIPVTIIKEDKRYVAHTPVFDISTSGTSYKGVKKRFEELVEVFLEELVSQGTLDETLKSLGWKKEKRAWQPPVVVGHEEEMVTLPV